MADFLTRLIERSRDLAPQGGRTQVVEPLIAPFYAAGVYAAPSGSAMGDVMDQEVISVAEQQQALAPRVAEAAPSQRPVNISIAPSSQRHESRDNVSPEFKPARALADETQSGQLSQTSGIEPLPSPTPKSMLPAAKPGLTATDDAQSLRPNLEPLMIRPQTVVRADESNSPAGITTNRAANEANGETAAPVIRVTIGRVEVRAVAQSAPPARRASPATPKLSLEEYLRSRSGRK